MDHGTILSKDLGDETEDDREKGSQEVRSHLDNGWKSPQRTSSHCSTRRKEPAYRQMGWHSTQEKTPCNPQRPTTAFLAKPIRTGEAPPGRYLRAMRLNGSGGGTSHPGAERPGTERKTRKTTLGKSDVSPQKKNPCRVLVVSQEHPCWTAWDEASNMKCV